MNSAVCAVVSYVLNAAWQIPLLMAAGWIASRVVRRWGPRPQHLVWVATWILSLIAPLLPVCRAIAYAMAPSSRNAESARISIALHVAGVPAAGQPGALLLPAWLIWLVIGSYACTLMYFTVRLLLSLAGARLLVRSGVPAKWNEHTNALWQKVRHRFAADASVLSSPSVRGVVTIGMRRPVIILPTGFIEQSTDNELLSALGHEMAHVARGDYAKNLLYEIGSLLTTFHPVTWMMKSQIMRTREMICDAIVVERLVDTNIYRNSLLRLAQRFVAGGPTNTPALGMFDGNLLKERIMMIKAKKSISGRLAQFGLAGIAALALLAAAILGTTFAKSVYAQTSNSKASWGTVYKAGKDVTAPVLVSAVDPEYPKTEKASAKTNVICVVGLIVDRDGTLKDVHIVRSAGKNFDANAIKAVKQYKFKPALHMKKPVPVAINIEVDFRTY